MIGNPITARLGIDPGCDPASRRIHLLEAVGNTPLLDLPRLSEEVAPVRICAKAEWYGHALERRE